MVSNYERIFHEITKEAETLAPTANMAPDVLITLAMEIVGLEDQHRIKNIRIKQLIEERIIATARSLDGGH